MLGQTYKTNLKFANSKIKLQHINNNVFSDQMTPKNIGSVTKLHQNIEATPKKRMGIFFNKKVSKEAKEIQDLKPSGDCYEKGKVSSIDFLHYKMSKILGSKLGLYVEDEL